MLCLGPKKSLLTPGLELTAQGVAYRCSKVECEDHSAIQAPKVFYFLFGPTRLPFFIYVSSFQTKNPFFQQINVKDTTGISAPIFYKISSYSLF